MEGGCDCVFMRMRYSRPGQSVPFVSLHYCTAHCTLHTAQCMLHTLHTAHYPLGIAQSILHTQCILHITKLQVGSECPLCVQPSLCPCCTLRCTLHCILRCILEGTLNGTMHCTCVSHCTADINRAPCFTGFQCFTQFSSDLTPSLSSINRSIPFQFPKS